MPGLCIPNLAGSIQWHPIGEEFGSGKKTWAGSGLMNNTIHSSTKILPPAGFISTEPARIDYCSTITGTNAGSNRQSRAKGVHNRT